MVNYFKSEYEEVEMYSKNWYGTYSYAPNAVVLLYDDNLRECYGYMESELPEYLTPLTQEQVEEIINNYEDADGVYFGEKLEHRWDKEVEDGG